MRMPHSGQPGRSLEPRHLLATIAGGRSPYQDDAARCEIQMSRSGFERQKAVGEKCHNGREKRAVTFGLQEDIRPCRGERIGKNRRDSADFRRAGRQGGEKTSYTISR